MKALEARNGKQTFLFDGELIGFATTQTGDVLRWTEIRIFRTQAGKYIIEKVGRSDVLHSPSGCRQGELLATTREIVEAGVPCPVCKPDGRTTTIYREINRYTAHVTETARGAVESLHSQDEDRTTYLTSVAKRALLAACDVDPNLRAEFLVQEID